MQTPGDRRVASLIDMLGQRFVLYFCKICCIKKNYIAIKCSVNRNPPKGCSIFLRKGNNHLRFIHKKRKEEDDEEPFCSQIVESYCLLLSK
jgi:hypothetical protein